MELVKERNEINYLWQGNLWMQEQLLTVFTTRLGGFSPPPYDSLNSAFHVGDNTDNVLKNRIKISKTLEFNLSDVICLKQVHGTDCIIASEEDKGKGTKDEATAIEGDAIIIKEPGIGSAMFFADCVPITVIDREKRIIASIHAGWQGTYNKITRTVMDRLLIEFSSTLQNLEAFIWPSIRGCCYKVGEERYNALIERFPEAKSYSQTGTIDLAMINRNQLLNCGLSLNKIKISDYCTSCRKDLFFSYRADGERTGRQSLISYILPKKDYK